MDFMILKEAKNSHFCVRTLRACEKAIFWTCLHSWPFGGMLQLLKSQELSRVCPVLRAIVSLHKLSLGALSYTIFLLDWWLNAAICFPNQIALLALFQPQDPGSDVKEQPIWSILTSAWLSAVSLTTLSQVNSGIVDGVNGQWDELKTFWTADPRVIISVMGSSWRSQVVSPRFNTGPSTV